MNFNPNPTIVLGPEIAPDKIVYGTIASDSDAYAQRIASTVASESVTTMAMYAQFPYSMKMLCEVLDAATSEGSGEATATISPNGSTATSCKNQAGTTTGTVLYQSVDETSPDDADYVESNATSGAVLNLEFATTGVTLTNKRILGVRLKVRAAKTSSTQSAYFDININGTDLIQNAQYLTQTPTTYSLDLGEIYAPSGQPWTVAQMQALDSGTPRITIALGSFNSPVRIYWVSLEIDYCDENRVSRTVVTFPAGAATPQRVSWIPQKPDGTNNFTKTSAMNTLLFVVRRPRFGMNPTAGPGTVQMLEVQCAEDLPAEVPHVVPIGMRSDVPLHSGTGAQSNRLLGMVEMLISGTASVDSQVYSTALPLSETVAGTWFTNIDQEFTPGATFSCAGVRLYGRYIVYSGVAVPDLTVNLRRRSDNVLIATGTLTRGIYDDAAAANPSATWQPLSLGWTGGTVSLTSGVQYFVEVLPGTGNTVWSFPLMAIANGATSEPQTWHGSTDTASRNGVATNLGDFPWLLLTPIDAPDAPIVVDMEAPIEPATGGPFGGPVRPPSYGAMVFSEGENAYYRLGESAGGIAHDEHAHAHGVNTDVVLGVDGAVVGNSAYGFNGASSYVQIADADGWLRFTTDVSVEAWVKPETTTGADPIWLCEMGSGYAYEMWLDNGLPRFDIYDGAGTQYTCVSPVPISTNAYHHIVATYAAGGMRLFVDTVEADTNLGIGITIRSGVGGCRIGREASNYFDGDIDEVALYNYALTAEQIAAHYEAATYVPEPSSAGQCIMSGIPFNRITWSATALGGSFGQYVLQRMDTFTDWQTIAYIEDENLPTFDDWEARINDVSCYRVAVMNAQNISSDWSDVACGAVLSGSGDGYTFTSNHSTASSVAYTDTYSGDAIREYASPEANELVTMALSGRDYVVAFQPCERRGVNFTREVLISALRTPVILGVHGFDALRDLAKMGLPYVCVRDENGDRFFSAISVPDFRIRNPKNWMKATVNVIEVSDVATPVVV